MTDLGRWLPTAVSMLMTVALVQNVAVAKSAPEINQIAQAITVRIAVDKGNGSGLLLQKDEDIYTVLTAAHVLSEATVEQLTITTADDVPHKVIEIRKYQGDVDLAIVKFRSAASYQLAELGDSSRLAGGMNLYAAGFPAPTKVITASVFVFQPGQVVANSKVVFADGYALLYNNPTLPGMSGGPILDETGKVVAIHGKGDRKEGTDIPTGFNAGIPVARFADIASKLGVGTITAVASSVQSLILNPDDYFVSAYQKYAKRDYQGALADLNQSIALRPDYALAYHNRGVIKYWKLNDVPGALVDLNRSIILKPDYALAYNNRGILKQGKLHDWQGALVDFDQSIKLNPDYAEVYINRSILKSQNLSDLAGALQDLDYSIKLNPNLASSYYNRGDFLYTTGQKAKALVDFRRAQEISPTDVIGLTATGIIMMEQGKLAISINNFTRTIQNSPQFGDALKYRGSANRLQGNTNQAIQDWKKATQFYKDNNYNRDYQVVRGWLKDLGVKTTQ
jgi:tetratricopeptide (TPR) repeat protein